MLGGGEFFAAGAVFWAVARDVWVQYTCGVSRREKPTPADNPAVLRLVQDVMHAAVFTRKSGCFYYGGFFSLS